MYQPQNVPAPYIPPYNQPKALLDKDLQSNTKDNDGTSCKQYHKCFGSFLHPKTNRSFIHYILIFLKLGDTLKSSKSVGDLMIEIQKETEKMTLDTEHNTPGGQNSKATVIRKSRAYSQTPPPSKGQANKDQQIR